MTRASLGWVVAGIVTVLACTLGAMQQQGEVGRYQLMEGRYQIITATVTVDCVAVWRIDTVTGDVVQFTAVDTDKKTGSGWVKVRDM